MVLYAGTTDLVIDLPLTALVAAIAVLVPTRLGLVALATLLAVHAIGGLWIPPFGTGFLVLQFTAMTAIGVVGFVIATQGRASTAWLDA